MSEELVVRTQDGNLVNPRSGAVITEESPDEDLADFLVFLRDGRKLLDSLDGDVSQWLRERADARGKWTIASGRVSMPSNRPGKTWDEGLLLGVIQRLADEGLVSVADRDACLVTRLEVDLKAVKALLDRASPAVATVIRSCQVEAQPKTSRRVSVSA